MLIDSPGLATAARIISRGGRVVGWGSGSVFDYFQDLFPVRLDYVIDNDSSRWGQRRRGTEIVPPGHFAADDPSTLVVIYSSAWPEIQRQVASLGGTAALPASAVFTDEAARARLARFEGLAAREPLRQSDGGNAIVIQGPLVDGLTPRIARVMSILNPSARVIVSTWHDSDSRVLAEAAAAADDIVLSAAPHVPGIQNRNAQIVSTRAGIERAVAHGATQILKMRSDLAVLADDVFRQARWLREAAGAEAAAAAGLRGRLIVPSSYTRKFLLYHPSDLVMLGAADDMAAFWSAPLDDRTGTLLSPAWIDRPLLDVTMSGNPAESYLGTAFCRTLGRPVTGTLADSWACYRDLFAVVDNDWFDLLWFKNLMIPDSARRDGIRQTVSHDFWRLLQRRAPDAASEAQLVGLDAATLRVFAAGCPS